MKELKDLTLEEFAHLTAGKNPVPGGGSVSAYVGALAAALAGMVADLTVGKKKYAEAEPEMREVARRGEALRKRMIEGIREDGESFRSYMDARSLPQETEEERSVRRSAMQEGLKEAALVPLQTACTAAEIFPLAETAVRKGNQSAVTDGLLSAILAKAAVSGALLNVRINLSGIEDAAFVSKMQEQAAELLKEAEEYEQRILSQSEFSGTFQKKR